MSFDHNRTTALALLASINNIAGEYRDLLNQPGLVSLKTGTIAGRPYWLAQLYRVHDDIEKQLQDARGGVNR